MTPTVKHFIRLKIWKIDNTYTYTCTSQSQSLNWMDMDSIRKRERETEKRVKGGKKPHGIMLYTSFIRLNKCYRKVSNVNNSNATASRTEQKQKNEDMKKIRKPIGDCVCVFFNLKMHRHINAQPK